MSDQPPLTPPPTAPAIGDDDNTFNTRAFALVAWLATFVSEMIALVAYVVGKVTAAAASADDADASASDAADSALSAAAVANFQGVHDAGTAYTTGQSVYYNGDYWIALQGSTGQTPAVGSAFWALAPGQPAERFLDTLPPATLDLKLGESTRYAKADGIVEARLESFSTFTRGGDVVNYFGPNGLIAESAIDEPVVEYDPGTRFRRGLLLEPVRTNDLLSSDQDANWSDSQVTSTKNATGPDGVASSAYTVLETAATNQHFAQTNVFVIVAEEKRVAFALVKQAGLSAADDRHFRLRLSSNNVGADFIYHDVDLFDGSSVAAAAAGNASLIGSGIEDAGGGYYRVWVAGAFDALTTNCRVLAQSRTPGALSYAGDTSKGFILYAADCTDGDFPTSHIDTAGSAVTRAASQLDILPAEAVNILNAEEGTLVCTINVLAYSASQVLIASVFLMDGTSADRVDLNVNSTGAGGLNALFRSIISGVQEDGASSSLGSVAFGTKIRLALTYSKGGNIQCSANGATLAVTQGDAWNGDVDRIRLTSSLAVAYEKVSYRPKRLTQTQLNLLTRNS